MLKLGAVGFAVVSALLVQQPDEWSATLKPSGGSTVSGTASAEGVGSADSTLVKISIRGAGSNAALVWHLHSGSCTAPGAVFGSDSAYPGLHASATGSAEASVTLPIRPVKAAAYLVQVHRGSDVVACGDLKPVLNKRPPD